MGTLIGETLSHFEILEFIGKGGFGEVYRARDTELDRHVAIKVLPEAVSADPAGRARFRREARAASRLSHPNVCTIYEFGEQDIRTFIAMELVPGQTLKDRIGQSPLGPAEALDVAIQIAEGLAAAHAMGILHLDIKSANIVQTGSGHVKILDFGLARLASAEHPPLESQTLSTETSGAQKVAGTLPYMAPEQLRGRAMDQRTDQFAFGVVCYELLSGRLPFPGDDGLRDLERYPQSGTARPHFDRPGPAAGDRLDRAPDARQGSGRAVCLVRRSVRRSEGSPAAAGQRPVHAVLFAAGDRSRSQGLARRECGAGCRRSRCWPSRTSAAIPRTSTSVTGCPRT